MSAALGHQLAQIRRSAALTPERVAAELGVTQEDVLAVEAGTRVFSESRPLLNSLSVCGLTDKAEERRLVGLWKQDAQAAGIEF
jgi:DNA-binding XRE family transcriptional regulator